MEWPIQKNLYISYPKLSSSCNSLNSNTVYKAFICYDVVPEQQLEREQQFVVSSSKGSSVNIHLPDDAYLF